MIIVAWNIRGVANKATIRTLKERKSQHRPDITLIYEPKCSGNKATEVIKALGFNFSFLEEADGYVGGIWVLWDNPALTINILETHHQYVAMEVKDPSHSPWKLTTVYASPQEGIRKNLWENLKRLADATTDAWMVIGDFNEIAEEGEKKGGARADQHACRRFKNWIQSCNLLDLGFVGSKYTWKGGQRDGMERVFKRLDRGLANAEWRRRYMNARVDILPRVNSDHHPLLVNLTPGMRLLGERSFRFEVMWKTHPSFNEFIEKTWTNDTPLPRALESLTEALKSWNLEVFGNVFRKKRTILNRLAGIQKAPTYGRNPHLEKLERDLSRELDQILNQEELLWLQKSRQQWIVDGDRNTKFYHTKTAIRRQKNRILKLRRGDGSWCEEQQELKDMVVSFYSSLYKEESTDYLSLDLPISYPVMKDEHKAALLKQPNNEEIQKAIFHIGSLKAPGEDGFQPTSIRRIGVCFVPGRVIHDNVIIAKEMIHDMKRMKGKKKFMAIKIDFAKAYDCLRWSFVDECIAEFGIGGILRALNRFGQVSGLKINAEKIAIVFSKNVEERLRNQISNISGFQEQSNLGKYLGAIISDNRKKKDNFKTTLDRVKNKLGGWKMNCLSMAGRITLAKAVISPILNYDMMHTQVPKGICKEVERIHRSFIWGDGRESRKVHAISWETICKPIKEGGLGFQKLSKMNEAFLQKIIWRLVMEKESLWAQVILSKYGRRQDLRQNILSKQSDSDLWRSLAKVWGSFKDNIEFSIGNGRRIRLWIDPWLKNEGARRRKLFGTGDECHRCNSLTEDQSHVLRDCPAASKLGKNNQTPWITKFSVTCWWLWRWRNCEIFSPPFRRPIDAIATIFQTTNSINEAFKKEELFYQKKRRVEIEVAWKPPVEGWIKFNSDGASNEKGSGCGGLARDHWGRWVAGFMANLRTCSAFQAELWGVCYALKTAWDLGFKRVELEVDSRTVYEAITKGRRLNQHPNNLIRSINIWLKKQWSVEIRHTYKEGNQAADWLAKKSVKERDAGYCFIDSPFVDLRSILDADMRGASLPRCVIDL
ncbi:uncharacterized protein [Arachis hypogaea]|uniref:uncharacterized protein n=1 Tax=Arachis hypogaea TaxID=3818 RepID=UPI000DEC2181|nr:uncharacterized protein LOC112805901 [Arachis hypogaea]